MIDDAILRHARDIVLEFYTGRMLVSPKVLPEEVREAVEKECEHCLRPYLDDGELGYHAADLIRAITQIWADQQRAPGEPRRPVWPHSRRRVE